MPATARRVRRSLPSFVVVASCALVVVTGSAVAASKFINGATLKNRSVPANKLKALSVTAAELKARSVTSTKLASNAVTSATLVDGAVTSSDLADGTVSTIDLAPAAVTGAQVADGSLGAVDLAANAVAGATVADGSLTRADLAVGTTGQASAGSMSGSVAVGTGTGAAATPIVSTDPALGLSGAAAHTEAGGVTIPPGLSVQQVSVIAAASSDPNVAGLECTVEFRNEGSAAWQFAFPVAYVFQQFHDSLSFAVTNTTGANLTRYYRMSCSRSNAITVGSASIAAVVTTR